MLSLAFAVGCGPSGSGLLGVTEGEVVSEQRQKVQAQPSASSEKQIQLTEVKPLRPKTNIQNPEAPTAKDFVEEKPKLVSDEILKPTLPKPPSATTPPVVQGTNEPTVKAAIVTKAHEVCISQTNLKLSADDEIKEKTPEQIQKDLKQRTLSKANKDKAAVAGILVEPAKESEKIKSIAKNYMTFKNLTDLKLISDSNTVVFLSKLIPENTAYPLLVRSNENQYCRVEGAFAFSPDDALVFAQQSQYLIDKKLDIYEQRLQFKNSHGILKFICKHTTPGFYFEEFARNFSAYFDLTLNKTKLTGQGFVNPFKEDRSVNVVKIKDVAKLEANQICKVSEKIGQLKTSTNYFKVSEGSVSNADTQSMLVASVYQADSENIFTLTCQVSKLELAAQEIMRANKDGLQFAVLERVDYNVKYKEMLDRRQGMNPAGKTCQP